MSSLISPGKNRCDFETRRDPGTLAWLVAVTTALWPGLLLAQSPNPFGVQDRADAVSRLIVLGVQQGISSLPPTSGQPLAYKSAPQLDTYKGVS